MRRFVILSFLLASCAGANSGDTDLTSADGVNTDSVDIQDSVGDGLDAMDVVPDQVSDLSGDADAAVGDAEAGKVKSAVCAGCHGMEGEGKEAPVGSPSFPSLAGQVASYFIKSVNAYKNDTRNDAMMGAIAKGLNDVDIANLAAYYTALK